jgi:hypothetical protein
MVRTASAGGIGSPYGYAPALSWGARGSRQERERRRPTGRCVGIEHWTVADVVTEPEQCLGATLFADALGFSKLPDAEVPLFVETFLGRIATVVDRYGEERIPVRETWGDGLFFVFPRLDDTALFALDVADLVNGIDWQAEGFSTSLTLRTALHHGPMYPIRDPITGRSAVCGAHITQAARLGPKTLPGHAYATEAFAARAALEGHSSFGCTFVKQLEFDKRYGTFPTYMISRPAAPARG